MTRSERHRKNWTVVLAGQFLKKSKKNPSRIDNHSTTVAIGNPIRCKCGCDFSWFCSLSKDPVECVCVCLCVRGSLYGTVLPCSSIHLFGKREGGSRARIKIPTASCQRFFPSRSWTGTTLPPFTPLPTYPLLFRRVTRRINDAEGTTVRLISFENR